MTVSSQRNKVIYVGNGVATEFAIPFSFLEQEHIKVRQKKNDIQTERTDWEINGGNIVFKTAPESETEIAIVREVPLTQETDYRDNEILHAETLERNFDKLTMQVQQLAEKSARAVTVDIFDDTAAASLIPSIRKAVSDCQTAVKTAAANAQTATARADAATEAATNAAASETNTAAMLETKADVNLSNLTAAGCNNVFLSNSPDYSAGIDVKTALTSATGYAAPENGHLILYGTAGTLAFSLTVNGHEIARKSTTGSVYALSFNLQLSQSDTAQLNLPVSCIDSAVFFPIR